MDPCSKALHYIIAFKLRCEPVCSFLILVLLARVLTLLTLLTLLNLLNLGPQLILLALLTLASGRFCSDMSSE